MATYAAKTEVSSQKSRVEIETTITRYGASSFAYASQGDKAMIGFEKAGRTIRFVIPLPDRASREFTHHSTGPRTETAAAALYEQAVRQKWRAMALMVKAKLEGVESGIVTFEQEFLAHTVLPNGRTVFEETSGGVERALVEGHVRPLLELGS
jgi:hypothetical protein